MFNRSIRISRSPLLRSRTILPRTFVTNTHRLSYRLKQRNPSTIFKQSAMTLITISQSLDEAYTKHKVIPEVVDQFDTQGLLSIEYGPTELVTLGNTLSVEGTQEVPKIQLTLNSPTEDGKI